MDNQIIEEIDIIVRAKVEEARKSIQNIAKATKQMVGSVTSDMKRMSDSGQLDKFKKDLDSAHEEIRKIKVNDGNANTSYELGIDMGKFKEEVHEARDEIRKIIVNDGNLGISYNLGENVNYDELLEKSDKAQEELTASWEAWRQKENAKPVNPIELEPYELPELEQIDSTPVKEVKDELNEVNDSAEKTQSKISKLGQAFRSAFAEASKMLKGVSSRFNGLKNSSKSFSNDLSKHLNKGIRSIKKFALSLLSVRSLFSVVSRAAQAYLSFDDTLNQAVQNCWNALGSLLAPMIEYIVGLFTKLTSVIASFVKALTGVDLVARANAKALDKQAKATKSAAAASKQLASIDDIDSLSTSKGSGVGGDEPTTISVEDIDVTPLMKFLNEAKKILSKLFDPVKEAWEKVGAGVFESMISMFESLGELCSTVFDSFVEVWTNGTGTEIVTNVFLIWQSLFDIVGAVADAISRAWKNNENGTKIVQHIANIFNDILKFVLDIGDSLKKWVISEDFQIMLEGVFGVVKDLFGYVEEFANWILKMYEKYLKPVIDDKLLPALTAVIQAIVDVWNTVKPVIDWICGYIGAVLEPVIKGLCGIIGGVIDVIRGIATFISGTFTGNWKKAWDGIKTIFQGTWDTMANIIKTPINAILGGIEWLANKIIDAFNAVKKALNKISFDIPSWVPFIGGKKWGFDLKISKNITIPRLAEGNVATQPTFAMFGEYANARSNPEITSPVSMMKDSFREVLNEFDFGGTRIDTLKIDVAGENFFDKTIDYINEQSERKGVSVIKEV